MEAEKQTEKTAGNPNTEGTTVQTDAPGQEPGMKLFAGDKVLWIIIAALAVISVLVVYSSTAKMAYDAHTARSTAHFLRQQLLILFVCVPLIIIVHKINSRIYNHLALVAYAGSVLLTLAVYFIGATTNGAARWIPLGPFQFQPSEALKGIDNRKLVESFTGIIPEIISTDSLDAAMQAARKASRPGDVVLLSPACASFDLFKNYENRGELFKQWVAEHAK